MTPGHTLPLEKFDVVFDPKDEGETIELFVVACRVMGWRDFLGWEPMEATPPPAMGSKPDAFGIRLVAWGECQHLFPSNLSPRTAAVLARSWALSVKPAESPVTSDAGSAWRVGLTGSDSSRGVLRVSAGWAYVGK